MDQRSDDIRQDIESTRAALDDKLDTLETKARQTFDLNHQVAERPWVALGAAVAAGYVLGSLGSESSDQQRWHGQPMTTTDYNQHAYQPPTSQYSQSRTDRFLSQFDDEIDMLKTAAIATITNLLRDSIREYFPAMGQQLDRTARERGVTSSSGSYDSGTSYGGSTTSGRTPSTATNTSYSTGAGRTGFDSPAETTSYGPNTVAKEYKGEDYFPPGSTTTTGDRDYVRTYQPPSETNRERAIGDDTTT